MRLEGTTSDHEDGVVDGSPSMFDIRSSTFLGKVHRGLGPSWPTSPTRVTTRLPMDHLTRTFLTRPLQINQNISVEPAICHQLQIEDA